MRNVAIRRAGRATLVVAAACLLASCIEQRLRREFTRADRSLLTASGMTLALCGTGTGLPDAGRAGPCTAVVAAGRLFLVDVGPGAWESADLGGLPVVALRGVLLTKLLSDDVADLGEAITRSWIAGRDRPLAIYGPPGTARVVADVDDVLRSDVAMRLSRHSADVLRPALEPAVGHELAVTGATEPVPVLDEDGLRITAAPVVDIGGVTTVGYRFDYRGRSVVVWGHGRNHNGAVRFAAGASVLVHEAANAEMIARGVDVMDALGERRWASFARESVKSHPSPVDAATTARDASVGMLILTRLYPAPTGWFEEWAFMRGVRAVFPNTRLGVDGMRVRLDPLLETHP